MLFWVWIKWDYGHWNPELDSVITGWPQGLWQEQAELITWWSTEVTLAFCGRRIPLTIREPRKALLLLPVPPFGKLNGPLGWKAASRISLRRAPLTGTQDSPDPRHVTRPFPNGFLTCCHTEDSFNTIQPQWPPAKGPSQVWKLVIFQVSD